MIIRITRDNHPYAIMLEDVKENELMQFEIYNDDLQTKIDNGWLKVTRSNTLNVERIK